MIKSLEIGSTIWTVWTKRHARQSERQIVAAM